MYSEDGAVCVLDNRQENDTILNTNGHEDEDFHDERMKGERDGHMVWRKGDIVLVKLSYNVQLPVGIEVIRYIHIYMRTVIFICIHTCTQYIDRARHSCSISNRILAVDIMYASKQSRYA